MAELHRSARRILVSGAESIPELRGRARLAWQGRSGNGAWPSRACARLAWSLGMGIAHTSINAGASPRAWGGVGAGEGRVPPDYGEAPKCYSSPSRIAGDADAAIWCGGVPLAGGRLAAAMRAAAALGAASGKPSHRRGRRHRIGQCVAEMSFLGGRDRRAPPTACSVIVLVAERRMSAPIMLPGRWSPSSYGRSSLAILGGKVLVVVVVTEPIISVAGSIATSAHAGGRIIAKDGHAPMMLVVVSMRNSYLGCGRRRHRLHAGQYRVRSKRQWGAGRPPPVARSSSHTGRGGCRNW